MTIGMAARRRGADCYYIKEPAIDIGGDGTTVGRLYNIEMRGYDVSQDPKNDGTWCDNIEDGAYHTVHSSHCLEHIVDYKNAIRNWQRISNKYVIITVPDEEMYERLIWPSIYNHDHKNSYTTGAKKLPASVNVFELLDETLQPGWKIVHVKRIDEGFDPDSTEDQTARQTCECVIEILLEKK